MKKVALLACLALVIALGLRFVRAEEDPWAAPPDVMVKSDEERAVLADLDRQKFIAAREKAQKLIDKDPGSFVGQWALAMVHHYEEGNFARALFHARRAEELLARRGLDKEWHKKVLQEQVQILSDMDRTVEELATLDRLAKLYPPGRPSRRIWPLLKEKRYDEARELAASLLTSEDPDERLSAHNGLMTIEEELRSRETMYQRARTATDAFPNSCILHRNAGVGAWERFRPQQAEEWLTHGATASDVDCADSPYYDLAWLYLLAGDINQCVSAIKKANGVPVAKQHRQRIAIMRRAMIADLLHVLGKPEEAETIATDVYEQPERTGQTSNSAAFARLTRVLRYWLALDNRLNFERERASYRGLGSGLATRARLVAARWEVRRALFQLAADENALITITRPNLGDVHVARWTVGGLVEILGPGVMKTAVDKARALDAEYPEAAPYLDALSGEIAFRSGELDTALAFADKALAGVPNNDGLIRWYVMAWQADAKWRQGDHAGAVAVYHEVLQKLPSALRILDLALPVTITNDGSARAKDAADGLAKSPRFTSSSEGFKLDVSSKDKTLTICLTDPHGMQFACESGDGDVEKVLDAFHLAAFSPKISVTQADLSSLDGSTTTRTADEVLQGIIEK